MAIKFRPLHDRVIVKRTEEGEKPGIGSSRYRHEKARRRGRSGRPGRHEDGGILPACARQDLWEVFGTEIKLERNI
jgi:hypothetical protein